MSNAPSTAAAATVEFVDTGIKSVDTKFVTCVVLNEYIYFHLYPSAVENIEVEVEVGSPSNVKLLFTEHHFSHAASAFYPSPFNDAIVLTLDGVGEWATTTLSKGKENKIVTAPL